MYPRAYLYFTAVLVVTVAAFFPTYFSRLGETDAVHHLHGVSATFWVLLLIAQTWFISQGRVNWHRAAGKASYVLAPLVVIGGLFMMQSMMVKRGTDSELAAKLLLVDTVSLPYFALFFALAILNRKHMAVHARCMVATIFALIAPATARFLAFYVPGFDSLMDTIHPFMFVNEAILLALIVHDHRKYGKLRFPYPLALGIFVATHLMIDSMFGFEWWRAYMVWVAGWPV